MVRKLVWFGLCKFLKLEAWQDKTSVQFLLSFFRCPIEFLNMATSGCEFDANCSMLNMDFSMRFSGGLPK